MSTPLQSVADSLPHWCAFETLPKSVQISCPERVVAASRPEDVVDCINQVSDICAIQGFDAIGFLSYEAATAFEPAMKVHTRAIFEEFPALYFVVYDPAKQGHADGDGGNVDGGRAFKLGEWAPDVTREEYDSAIQGVRHNIKEGDMYQANYTLRLSAPFTGNASSLACRLVQAQRCGFGSFINAGRYHIASASPELFFHWDMSTGQISTRPMKGTRRRGLSCTADAREISALKDSSKDQAENLMIVDLLRNDIGRVAVPGTVRVQDLFKIERYPTVLQMTSTITAATRPGTTLVDVLTALFPCGSITGAPKISAMRGIAQLEASARHVYCGAILHIRGGSAGSVTASVPIRTVIVDTVTGKALYGVGGGITWDSTATGEYDEVLAKATVLQSAQAAEVSGSPLPAPADLHPHHLRPGFRLLETMRWQTGGKEALEGFTYLDAHLARLASSAEYFSWPLSLKSARRALMVWCAGRTGSRVDHRVRLLVDAQGEAEVESTELTMPPYPAPWERDLVSSVPAPLSCVLSGAPTPATILWLYHKTTNRGVYEQARRDWLAQGMDDVLLWNEEGYVQEFCIGNIVAEVPASWLGKGESASSSSVLVTPPVTAGLLPGIARAAAIQSGHVHEYALHVRDLPSARAVWLLNSVRGWVPVRLHLDTGIRGPSAEGLEG